jgi:hypothetical protein
MQYIIFVHGDGDAWELYTAPIAEKDAAYLQRIIATLRPLSDEEYMHGPAVVLHTFAKYSYVLDGKDAYWCIEWQPGLIVVRLSPTGPLAWTAIRSPVPNFGGREATQADLDNYDEDAENPQYNLIFDPWDAQFEAQEREWKSFVPADAEVQTWFQCALAQVNELGQIMEQRFSQEREAWSDRCMQNLEKWAGEGVRLT